jgi:hypothetical protein
MDGTGARVATLTKRLHGKIRQVDLDCNETRWQVHCALRRCLRADPGLADCRDDKGDWRCDLAGRSRCPAEMSEPGRLQ